ncbi:MAG: GAF and ANTAR domain-containing protein [Nocardioidaceae bacterium]|jgi:transcriptional regulator with GAF, ATPase, and Fis domain|nr:GAF and ANTAR domain-containing protein [Nocardioidaceae bacterium]
MIPRTPAQALADAASALVHEQHVTDILARLLRDCAATVSADAIGLMVVTPGGDLELLSSTSHRVKELELFQIQQDLGPCVDAISNAETVGVWDDDALRERWTDVGSAIVEAGYHAVHAFPLRWQQQVVGGLNVFWTKPGPRDRQDAELCQAFADVATLAIVHSVRPSADDVGERVHLALEGRHVIEQAKGLVAYQQDLPMSDAYDWLVTTAAKDGGDLTATAAGILRQAHQHEPG